MIIFESVLITYELSIVFEAAWQKGNLVQDLTKPINKQINKFDTTVHQWSLEKYLSIMAGFKTITANYKKDWHTTISAELGNPAP